VAIANRLRVAYPIVLVLGGLAVGFIPGVPTVALPPEVVLILFLPGLLYWESVSAPTSEFRAQIGPIVLLAVGLVIVTTAVVAVVAHALIPGMGWAVAFVLGAIVSSTDEVAFTPVAERLRLPRHVIAIIEGESLINDATSLVLYATAVSAVVSGSFSLWYASLFFVIAVVGSIIVGVVAGWIVVRAWSVVRDSSLQTIISLMAPFLSYLPAQALHISAVLATVTTGLFVNRSSPFVLIPRARMRAAGFWTTIVFVLNALIFVLAGMQCHAIMQSLPRFSYGTLLLYGAAMAATVIVVRIAWLAAQGFLGLARFRGTEHQLWRHIAVESWCGMRGGVSLAAAFAIPLVAGRAPFPNRDLIIFLTFCVMIATLVGQGGTLPILIRWLHIRSDSTDVKEESFALSCTAKVAVERLHELTREGKVSAANARWLEKRYAARQEAFGADAARSEPKLAALSDLFDVERQMIDAERKELVALRNRGTIDNTIMRRVQMLLDLEDMKIDLVERKKRTDIDATEP